MELNAGEVAAEKGSGLVRTEPKMEKGKPHSSRMCEKTVMEETGGLFKAGYQIGGHQMGGKTELKPPTPPKVVVSPPSTRRPTGWFRYGRTRRVVHGGRDIGAKHPSFEDHRTESSPFLV